MLIRFVPFALLALCLPAVAAPTPSSLLKRQPLRFEPNRGQSGTGVLYTAHSAEGSLALTASEALIPLGGRTVRMSLRRGNRHAKVAPELPLPSRSDYYLGRNPKAWQTNVPHFARVRYEEVYPKIDVAFHGRNRELEYDFIVAPAGDPTQIRVRFSGADEVSLASDGALLVRVGKETLRQPAPYVFQEGPQGQEQVQAGYKLVGKGEVAFAVGSYDRSRRLVIDPVLNSTYYGASNSEWATAIAADPTGGYWITGYTTSNDLVLVNAFSDNQNPGYDIFVAKFTADLTLQYATFLGGTDEDRATAIAVNSTGDAFITGFTSSIDFPLAGGSYQTNNAGQRDAFIARISLIGDPGAGTLWYSSLLGGAVEDVGNAITISPEGQVYIAGYTASTDFPLIGSYVQGNTRGGWDAFVAQFDPFSSGSASIAYSSYFGGGGTDIATSIAVGPNQQLYFAGYTTSTDFPISGDVPQASLGGSSDGFVAHLNMNRAGLDQLDYCTFLGGTDSDFVNGLRLSGGRLYVTGYTNSVNFPTTTATAFQVQKSGDADVFLTRLETANDVPTTISYSTYLGGNGADVAFGIDVDSAGRVAIAGYTYSTNFPRTANANQSTFGGSYDGFVSLMNPNVAGRAGLVYSTYFGGPATEAAYGVALDGKGNMAITGFTTSTTGIASGNSMQGTLAAYTDTFVGQFNLCDISGICAR